MPTATATTKPQLLRLQHILVLRELGLALADIAEAIDSDRTAGRALRRQYGRLIVERDRLARVAETVRADHRRAGREARMSVRINRPENLFEGFDCSQYDDEARERWPEEFERAQARSARP